MEETRMELVTMLRQLADGIECWEHPRVLGYIFLRELDYAKTLVEKIVALAEEDDHGTRSDTNTLEGDALAYWGPTRRCPVWSNFDDPPG